MKRPAEDEVLRPQGAKRLKQTSDRLSVLSDELILRIFSHVPVETLAICQRVSQRLKDISSDSELWKAAYYDRFVRPRAHRLPRRRVGTSGARPSRLAKWLDESDLVSRGKATNWKRQYKLRHNWSKGSCDVSEIPYANKPPAPPILARLHDGIIYAVDQEHGLRVWSYKGDQKLLGSLPLLQESQNPRPMSFALDSTDARTRLQRMAVGFDDGSFSTYTFDTSTSHFKEPYQHPASSRGTITSIAYTWPYLLSMTENQALSLYKLSDGHDQDTEEGSKMPLEAPRLLASLKSHTVWYPLSVALRLRGDTVIAWIAYSLPTFNAGWSTGLQELQFSLDGQLLQSRLASANPSGFVPRVLALDAEISTRQTDNSEASVQRISRPTSLSYSHPYLLVSHADNTLTLYLVERTDTTLSISAGRRLWGHTSSVFGAHVGGRGKAVSVSSRGDEIRVWELEGAMLVREDSTRVPKEQSSVQISPERIRASRTTDKSATLPTPDTRIGLGCGAESGLSEASITRGWVGFDEENVVVLKERAKGHQALTVYDFT